MTQLSPLSHWRGPGLFVKDTEAERRILEGKVQAAEQVRDQALAEVDAAVRARRDAEATLRNANVSRSCYGFLLTGSKLCNAFKTAGTRSRSSSVRWTTNWRSFSQRPVMLSSPPAPKWRRRLVTVRSSWLDKKVP